MALFNESNQGRFNQFIARLHDIKGNPAPQVEPEIGHNVQIAGTNIGHELDAVVGVRNCFAGITAPARGVGVGSGVVLQPGSGSIVVVTGIQFNKATAGFVSVQVTDLTAVFGVTLAASFCFFRDNRLGPYSAARPSTAALTQLTGVLPSGNVFKRIEQPVAGAFTSVEFKPGLVLVQSTPAKVAFGVFNETLNEAIDVMIDFYERAASPSELVLPQ